MKKVQAGFTLIELMIVIAIIGILTQKARFSEVILATSTIKTAIEVCFQGRGVADLANCDTDAKTGADSTGAAAGNYVKSVAITGTTGVITATGDKATIGSTADDTYTLTPTAASGTLTWAEGGSCIAAGLC